MTSLKLSYYSSFYENATKYVFYTASCMYPINISTYIHINNTNKLTGSYLLCKNALAAIKYGKTYEILKHIDKLMKSNNSKSINAKITNTKSHLATFANLFVIPVLISLRLNMSLKNNEFIYKKLNFDMDSYYNLSEWIPVTFFKYKYNIDMSFCLTDQIIALFSFNTDYYIELKKYILDANDVKKSAILNIAVASKNISILYTVINMISGVNGFKHSYVSDESFPSESISVDSMYLLIRHDKLSLYPLINNMFVTLVKKRMLNVISKLSSRIIISKFILSIIVTAIQVRDIEYLKTIMSYFGYSSIVDEDMFEQLDNDMVGFIYLKTFIPREKIIAEFDKIYANKIKRI